MARPLISGRLPIFASSPINYPAGANPWNGQPRIVNPGAGAIQAGYTPNVPPGAGADNYWSNRADQFLDYLDAIDALNFYRSPDAFGFTYNNPSSFERLTVYGSSTYFLVGSSGITAGQVFNSSNGFNWRNESASIPATGVPFYTMAAVDPINNFLVVASDTSSKTTYRNTSGAYTHLDLTSFDASADNARWLEKDFTSGVFLVGGSRTSGSTFPAIYTITETGGGATAAVGGTTITNPGNAAHGKFVFIATSTTFRVAIALLTAPSSQFNTWTNSSLGSAWTPVSGTLVADPFASSPFALACSPSGVFMVTCASGQVYTSTDGNWTLQSTQTDGWAAACLAARGSTWLAAALTGGGVPYLKMSVDNGVTWTRVAWPFDDTVLPAGIVVADNRFHVSGKLASVYYAAQSLRTIA